MPGPGNRSQSSDPELPQRRTAVRRKTRPIPVSFDTLGAEGKGLLKNVSPEGLCILTRRPLEVGSMAHVEFQDSEQNLIKLTGVVRWSEGGGADGGSDPTPRFGMLIDRPISKAYLAFLKGLLAGPEA